MEQKKKSTVSESIIWGVSIRVVNMETWMMLGNYTRDSTLLAALSLVGARMPLTSFLVLTPHDELRRVYLVDFTKLQDNFDRMLDWLLEGNPSYAIEGYYSKYHYKKCTIEKNAFGKWMVNNDRIKPFIDKKIVVDHETQGGNKNDPEAGVFAMGSLLQDGRFRIPYAEASDQDKSEQFIGELLMYPKGTCDLVMAMWLATQNMSIHQTKYASNVGPRDKVRWFKNPAFG